MLKSILVGTTALVIAGSSLVYAQNRSDGARRWQPNLEDMRAFGDARLAGLKAGLALKPDQEKNWPAFEQAARDFQKLRLDRLSAGVDARRGGQSRIAADPAERMQQRAVAMAETSSALKKLADATGPLYTSLDDSQKRRFGILSRRGLDVDGGRAGPHRMMHDGARGLRRTDGSGMMMHDGARGLRRTDGSGIENGQGAPSRLIISPIRGEEQL
jgi:zinc resistance-associated protein